MYLPDWLNQLAVTCATTSQLYPPTALASSHLRPTISTTLIFIQILASSNGQRYDMKRERIHARLKKASNKTGKCLKTIVWQTCKCVLWTACAPCLCCAMICLPRRRRRRQACHHHIEYEHPQFPAPRPRALSMPLIEKQEDQLTLDQPQSDFSKLPLELRRMIYERALGGATIHLQTYKGRPRARQCWQHEECRCDYFDPLFERDLSIGLSLLRTCRLIYSEAIEYLYSANTFSLSTDRDEQTTVNYLSHYFLPHRLAQIRDLRFHWYLDITPFFLMPNMLCPILEPWVKSWDALSRLTGLRKLHVVLEYRYSGFDDCYERMWKEREAELLAAIKTVTTPHNFVVILPDRRCATDVDVSPSSCVFKLPDRVHSDDSL